MEKIANPRKINTKKVLEKFLMSAFLCFRIERLNLPNELISAIYLPSVTSNYTSRPALSMLVCGAWRGGVV